MYRGSAVVSYLAIERYIVRPRREIVHPVLGEGSGQAPYLARDIAHHGGVALHPGDFLYLVRIVEIMVELFLAAYPGEDAAQGSVHVYHPVLYGLYEPVSLLGTGIFLQVAHD